MVGTKATADLIPRYRGAPFVFPYTLAPPLNNLFFAFARTLSDLLAARQLSRADCLQERIRGARIPRARARAITDDFCETRRRFIEETESGTVFCLSVWILSVQTGSREDITAFDRVEQQIRVGGVFNIPLR